MLFTALTSDEALEAGIVTEKNITPILYFWILVWEDERLQKWLLSNKKRHLNEGNWLCIVRWLKDEHYLNAQKNSKIADLLMQEGRLRFYTTSRSIQTVMSRPINNKAILSKLSEMIRMAHEHLLSTKN